MPGRRFAIAVGLHHIRYEFELHEDKRMSNNTYDYIELTMSDFDKEVAARIAAATGNKMLQAASREFLNATMGAGYSQFSWRASLHSVSDGHGDLAGTHLGDGAGSDH